MEFTRLFEPFHLGTMEVRNRIVMPAMANGLASDDGYVTQQTIDYFGERARGGVGLIIVGYAVVEFPRGLEGLRRIAIDNDKYLPGLTALTQRIKQFGARVAVELCHAGGFAVSSVTGVQPVAPSRVIWHPDRELPRELTIDEIRTMEKRFVDAAERARRAGFDGVELHASGEYLINEFLSRAKNKRTDAYGGNLRARARFLLEILTGIKDRLGKDYPVWVRLSAMEQELREGITLEETKELSRILEQAGCCAISVNNHGAKHPFHRMMEPPGSSIYLAEAVKKAVTIPVIAVGRITPEVAEKALQEGKTDLVAIGRGLIADPELPKKAAEGRLDEIVPCITCLACFNLTRAGETACTTNPALGKEGQFRLTAAPRSKEILVVGGGPAGMEAAIFAASRGHHVTLCEKSHALGGRMHMAAKMPHRARISDLTEYLSRQLERHNVKVELGKTVTPELVQSLKPDAVIVATGARFTLPKRALAMIAGLLAFWVLGERKRVVDQVLKDRGGRKQSYGAHSLILAAARPDQRLLQRLPPQLSEVYLAGDCVEPFGIMEAVAAGARAGLAV